MRISDWSPDVCSSDLLSQFITDCTPDTSTLAVQVTTDGCNDPANWLHDISAGVSYGQERYFFVDGGQRKYITSCQNSTTTYMQHVEITGWQNHDARSEEHTSELQSLMRISYAVFC